MRHKALAVPGWIIRVIFAGLLLTGLQISATGQKSPKSAAPKKSEAGPSITLTGCLHKKGSHYTLGAGGKLWELSSKTVKLEENVEKTVEVTGHEIHPSTVDRSTPVEEGGSEAPEAFLAVSKIRVVMSPCGQ